MAITLEGTQGIGWHKVRASWVAGGSVLRWPRLFHVRTRMSSLLRTAEGDMIQVRLWNGFSGCLESPLEPPALTGHWWQHAQCRASCGLTCWGQGQGFLSAEVKVGQCAWALAFCFTPVKTRTKPMTLQPSRPTSVPYTPKERCLKTFLYAFHIIW